MAAIPSLRTSRDFRRVFERGRRGRSDGVAVFAATEPGPTKLGIAAGRRSSTAVARNRVKRRIREAFRATPVESGLEVVVQADGTAHRLSYQELTEHLHSALRKAGALA